MNIDSLKREFTSPSSTYCLAPFWFLNHDMDDSELRWQINEMNRKGVKGFILHARHGLLTPYMSDEWMHRIDTCLKEADTLRMKAYLYDEDNWPSGPVSGQLIQKFPQHRMSGCYLSQEWTVQDSDRLTVKIDTQDGLIGVVAIPIGRDGQLEGLPGSVIPLAQYIREDVLDWIAPSGTWQVMVFARKYLVPFGFFGSYLDVLSREAVAEFVNMTHEKYAARFAEYFGGTIDGIFTDEPSMNYNPKGSLPWTQELPAEFGWHHSYDILGALPAAFKEAGPATAQLRCDLFDTITDLYSSNFFRQIYEWCTERRLNFIGHVNDEGELYGAAVHQGDFFRGAKYMHFGGVDFLTDATWPDPGTYYRQNNLVGPKLASSAAHIYGKSRVMSEAFGLAGGWGIDLRTLKSLTDWQIALGINLIQPHAFYYSLQGYRKWECPPSEFYQSAFWPYYRTFADYVARLCAVLSDALHIADVAVVYPVRSMWAALDANRTRGGRADHLIRSFEKVTAGLLAAGFDFDILPEEELFTNLTPAGLEHLRSLEQYKVIVLPGCSTILGDTAHFLSSAIEVGAAVVICDAFPEVFVTEGSEDWDEIHLTPDVLADLFRLQYRWESADLDRRPTSAQNTALSAFIPDIADKTLAEVTEAMSKTLTELIDPDVEVCARSGERPYVQDIVHAHYRRGDVDFLFLVNTSPTEKHRTSVKVNALGVPAIWDAQTGDVKPLSDYEFADESLVLNLKFEPTQSYLISITPGEVWEAPAKPERKHGKEKTTELGTEWQFQTLKPNVLPISDWRLKMSVRESDYHQGLNEYSADFECNTDLTTARLLIDGLLTEKLWRGSVPAKVEITLNDQPIEQFEQGQYLDHLIMEADISKLIKRGRNVLRVLTETQFVAAANLSDPAYIVGDFALAEKAGKWRLEPEPRKLTTGSWADQGYPFYSGIGCYGQKVRLSEPKGQISLRIDKPADLAEVFVNGQSAGVLAWEPWELDITRFLKSGDNDIEIRVANSMENIFCRHPKPSGILGRVEIVERA